MKIGDTISHYRVLSRIGHGGMGVVYQAEDTRLQRIVALKFLPPESLTEQTKARFLREAQTAARLSHPNICPIFAVDEVDENVFFAMAYLEGQTLSTAIGGRPLDIQQAIDIAIQIASGLEEAHRQGVIHRDIKANNVILGAQGQASILDFGLALSSGTSRITIDGGVVGTPSYMSPEQAQGLAVDHRTDIWSLGVLLYEMLTGRRPFERDRDVTVLYGIVHEPPPSLVALRPELPPELVYAVERALAKKPDDRWQSARLFGDALRKLRDGRSSSGLPDSPTRTIFAPSSASEESTVETLKYKDPTATKLLPPHTGKRRVRPWAAGVLLLLAVGLGAGLWFRHSLFGPHLAEEKHIAILPFDVIGNDPGMLAISDGLVETLTSRLSQSEEFQNKLMIVPASEIRSRRITSVEEARRIYGVNLVITGNAHLLKDTVQFNINLINATTMRQIGARSFDFDARNPIGLRNETLNRVLSLVDVELSGSARRVEGETSTPAAYTEYLKGRGYLARYDVGGNVDRAIESLKNATQLDPKYALAFAGLGEAYWRKALATSEKHWANRAEDAAREAVRLDENLAVAHAKLGDLYAQSGRQADAIAELQTALRLQPRNSEAHRGLAGLYNNMGRFEEAEQSYLQVTRYRPTDWYAYLMLGVFYWDRNRYPEAEKAFGMAAQLTPDNDIVHRNIAGLFITEGKYGQAREEIQKALKLKPSARGYSVLGVTYFFERRFQEAATALEASVDLDSSLYTAWGNLGSAYRLVPGNAASPKAIAALQRAVELAQKRLDVTPQDYNIRANLAEYLAKLGDAKNALAEIARIPEANRSAYWSKIAMAYDLAGDRPRAVAMVEAALSNAVLPNEVKDDPDLAGVLGDPAVQRAVRKRLAAQPPPPFSRSTP